MKFPSWETERERTFRDRTRDKESLPYRQEINTV